jgi:plasmid stabilization system protein ParE
VASKKDMPENKKKPVVISPLAQQDIESILKYLSENWDQKVIEQFLQKLELFYVIVSINPRVFGYYNKSKNIRNYAIGKQQVIYYRIGRKCVEIITVFDSRQSPLKLKKILSK